MTIEAFKTIAYQEIGVDPVAATQKIISLIDNNPSLINARDPEDNCHLISFILNQKKAPVELLKYLVTHPAIDWTSKDEKNNSMHKNVLLSAAEHYDATLIDSLKENSDFLKGDGEKSLYQLATENLQQFEIAIQNANTNRRPPSAFLKQHFNQRKDTGEEIVKTVLEITKNNKNNASLRQASIFSNENPNINNFLNLSRQYKEIKTDFLQKQTQVLIDDNKETLALMKRLQPNFLNNSNISPKEKENFKNMVQELEKDIQTTLTM